MTPKDVIVLAVPIIVAIASGAFAYLTARKVAEKNAAVEHERTVEETRQTDATMMSNLNQALQSEITKLRSDRDEDEKWHKREILDLKRQVANTREQCEDQEQELRALAAWARTVVGILRRPDVAALLSAGAIAIPAPPDAIERKRS